MTGKPDGRVCPMHGDEFVQPTYVGSETAEWSYTCPRTDHPSGSAYSWPYVPEPVSLPGDSLGLGLDIELPRAVKTAGEAVGGNWVEYGIVERAYALANPDDWALLLRKYSHTFYFVEATQDTVRTKYSASMYLARSLSALATHGTLAHNMAPGTGRWAYNNPISFLALAPGEGWPQRTTWEASGFAMTDYMPVTRPR